MPTQPPPPPLRAASPQPFGMTRLSLSSFLAIPLLTWGFCEDAAALGVAPDTLTSINADYQTQRLALEKARLDQLTKLAAKQAAPEADLTYRMVLELAIGGNLYQEAEASANRVLGKDPSTLGPETRFLAHLIKIIAAADRKAYDESLKYYEEFAAKREEFQIPTLNLGTQLLVTLSEAYLQRLLQGDQFDIAKKVCAAGRNAQDPGVARYFSARYQRLALLGLPAPVLKGTTADGKPLALADYRGKIVFVIFWASWCVPTIEQFPALNELVDYLGDAGVIVGVNVDALQDDAPPWDAVSAQTRKLLADHKVRFPNILLPNTADSEKLLKSFGVQQIPANLLIGRDGKILHLDLTSTNGRKILDQALGKTGK